MLKNYLGAMLFLKHGNHELQPNGAPVTITRGTAKTIDLSWRYRTLSEVHMVPAISIKLLISLKM